METRKIYKNLELVAEFVSSTFFLSFNKNFSSYKLHHHRENFCFILPSNFSFFSIIKFLYNYLAAKIIYLLSFKKNISAVNHDGGNIKGGS